MEIIDFEEIYTQLTALITTWGPKVVGAIAVLIVGRIAAGWSRQGISRVLHRSKMDATLVPFLASLVYYLVLAFAIIAALQILGLQTTSLVAVLGGVALAIGLALQDTVSDIASGAMLLAFRPFSLGQYVDIDGTEGTVKGIALFTTTLDTADNVRLIMPNSSVWGQVIKNYGVNDTRRIDLLIGVSYADDLSKVKTIIEQVIAEDDRILAEPAPVVAVHELADSSVNLVVRPWCKREDYWTVRWDITQRVKEALEAQGCSIPFPQRDIHLIRESADVA